MRPKKNCTHPGCNRPHLASGYCNMHYGRWRKGADMDAPAMVERIPRVGTCKAEGCDKPIHERGYCTTHYKRLVRGQVIEGPPRRAANGTGHLTPTGYVQVRDAAGRQTYEHRVVWAEAHGPIPEGWHVHHRNGIKTDNRLENLELIRSSDHTLHHNPKEFEWSRYHPACAGCGTSERKHFAKGLCERCYFRVRRALP